MNIIFDRRSFRFMNWTVRDLLCWQWFLILCKLPLFTFSPSSLMSNLYVWNSISRDCGSIRPIQPKTMNVPASMVCVVVRYRVGWLSAHCSYYYPRSRKALSLDEKWVWARCPNPKNPDVLGIFGKMKCESPGILDWTILDPERMSGFAIA